MKNILIFLITLFSFNTFANCSDDFNEGISEYQFAAKYFESGVNAYNKALELSQTGNADFLVICNLLVNSVSGFNVAKTSYGSCTSAFDRAISSCSGSDSDSARNNKEVCENNSSVASDNEGVLRNLLKNTCFKRSSQLEEVNLLSVFEI